MKSNQVHKIGRKKLIFTNGAARYEINFVNLYNKNYTMTNLLLNIFYSFVGKICIEFFEYEFFCTT